MYSVKKLLLISGLTLTLCSSPVLADIQDDLCTAAQDYFQAHSDYGYRPSEASCTDNGDGTYTIQLYDIVDDGSGYSHTATSAWYKVDRYGIGTDTIMGTPIQLDVSGGTDGETGYSQNNSWSDAYFDFIMNGNYQWETDPAFSLKENEFTEPEFALYDMDRDGTPELIAFNGEDAMAFTTCYVYSMIGGDMKYLGSAGFRDCTLTYYDDPAYPGLFCRSGNMGYLMTYYYTIQDGTIYSENVLTENFNEDGEPPITRYTQDDILYLKLIKDARETLTMYTVSEIQRMGWNAFEQTV